VFGRERYIGTVRKSKTFGQGTKWGNKHLPL
jgi:hypothetical protein